MVNSDLLNDLTKKLADSLPSGVKEIQQEIERNFNAVLQATFAKLNLVTREEFDVQVGVLLRTRAKLEKLEKRLDALENLENKNARKTHKTKAASKREEKK